MHFAALRLMTLVACLAPAIPAAGQGSEAALYEAAKAEKKLVYWGSPDVKVFHAIHAEFSKKYPGVTFEMSKLQGAAAIDRVIGGKAAGRNDVDFIDTPVGYIPLLTGRGLADSFDWTGVLGVPAENVLYEGRGVVSWDIDMPIAFNSNLVKPGDIKSWDDLLDPKWRGKLLIEKRGLAFAVLALRWGEAKTQAYLKALMENRPIITVGSTATIEALAGGQGAIAVGPYGGTVLRTKGEGAPIDVAMVGPVPAMLETSIVIRDAPHPAAARLWINFLISPRAQQVLYEGQGLGFVHGPALSPMGELYRKSGLEIVLESTDAPLMQKLVTLTSSSIGKRE